MTTGFGAPGSVNQLEEGLELSPKFDSGGLLTAVVCDHVSGDLLMVAHMNETALAKTLESGVAWFWSRSRGELWRKGETSGAVLHIVEIRLDCDQDAVLLRVNPEISEYLCHTGRKSCFYRRIVKRGNSFSLEIIE
jgi:phosphoribosyl-AMP cyclohydrolase